MPVITFGGKKKESSKLRLWNLNICIEKVEAKCGLAEMTLVMTSLPLASMFFNVCLHSRLFPLRADWRKSDSSVDGEPQGNWRWNSTSGDVLVSNSPSFSRPAAGAPRRACLQASISRMWNMCVVSWVLISRRNVSQVSSSLYQSKSWSWESVYDSWFQAKLFEDRYSSLISNCFCHVTFPWWTQLWRTAKLFVPHPNKLYSPLSCGARGWLMEIALLQLHLPSCVARQLLCQVVMIQGHATTASSQFCTLSRVLLDLYKCILSGAIKFVFVRSSYGNLSLFEIERASLLFFRKF